MRDQMNPLNRPVYPIRYTADISFRIRALEAAGRKRYYRIQKTMNIKPKYGDKLFCSTKRGDERVGVWKLAMPYNAKFDAVSVPAASLIPPFVFASLGLSGKVFADIRRDQGHRLEFTAFAGITWAG